MLEKISVVLISEGNYWNLLFSSINLEAVQIVAVYGDETQFSPQIMEQLKGVFRPIECFGKECGNYKDTYFIYNIWGDIIRSYLDYYHIDRQYSISLEYPEGGRIHTIANYYALWKFLEKEKPAVDFFTTGISFTRDGFDVPTMLPYKGVTLAFLMQDMYYSYKMALEYLTSCLPENTGGG